MSDTSTKGPLAMTTDRVTALLDAAMRVGVDAGMVTGKRLRGINHSFSDDYGAMAIAQDAAKAAAKAILAALDSPPDHGGGKGDAGKKVADRCHPSHVTRISMDASSYDEICVQCGATDHIGGWGKLAKPCPRASLPTQALNPTSK